MIQTETMIEEKNKGKRVELIYTDDQFTKLKTGDKGTYEFCLRQPDGKHQHCIHWDNGSNLMLIQGIDQFKFIEGDLHGT